MPVSLCIDSQVISIQHSDDVTNEKIRADLLEHVIKVIMHITIVNNTQFA
jgi:S-adenosylmethionine synthetase